MRDSAAASTWTSYEALMRCAIDALASLPRVVLGAATPSQLPGWPIDRWLLLDCSDDERRRRLGSQLRADDLEDAEHYRTLGLDAVDSTALSSFQVAQALAARILA